MSQSEPRSEQRPDVLNQPENQNNPPTQQLWSFNQPVLLKKTNRNRSVLVWTLVSSVALSGLWAYLAPLQETVAVQGKLQPTKPVQDIKASVPGIVEAVLVKDGEMVSQGDALIRFDARDAKARLEKSTGTRDRLLNQVAISRALLGELDTAELTPNQQQQLNSQRQEQGGENTAATEALARSRVRYQGLQLSLSTAENVAARYAGLLQEGASSALQALEAQAKVDELRSQVEAERREIARLSATATATISGNEAQGRKEIETNLRLIGELNQEIEQIKVLLSNITITAPLDGLVFDLSVSRGSVVKTQGELKPLLKLIPQDQLVAKVYLPNSAIGFIQPGQRADVALTSFPREDYGFIHATVKRIGSDALTPEEQQRVLGTQAQGLYFPTILELQRQTLVAGQRDVPLQAGMSLTADIFLRERRFISTITGGLENRLRGLERMR